MKNSNSESKSGADHSFKREEEARKKSSTESCHIMKIQLKWAWLRISCGGVTNRPIGVFYVCVARAPDCRGLSARGNTSTSLISRCVSRCSSPLQNPSETQDLFHWVDFLLLLFFCSGGAALIPFFPECARLPFLHASSSYPYWNKVMKKCTYYQQKYINTAFNAESISIKINEKAKCLINLIGLLISNVYVSQSL